MSRFLVLPLLLLISCVSEQKPSPDTVGDTKKFEPITNIEDNQRVLAICNALSAKESVLNILASSSKQFTFSFAQKNCDSDKMPEAKLVPTVITRSDANYFFKSKNGEAFGFNDVETSDSGVMKAICNFGGTLESPLRSAPSSKTAVWWTTFTDTKHCQAGFGNLCVHLQTGTSKDGYNYKINTNEWIKFKVMDTNEGFFIERKLISSAGCSKGKTLEMKAVLK